MTDADVLVVGGGVAGLAAATFAARSGLRTTVVEALGLGGQLMNAGRLDGWPADVDVTGPQLAGSLADQALDNDVGVHFGTAERLLVPGDQGFQVTVGSGTLSSRTIVVATGSAPLPLDVPGEAALTGHGVSHCPVCDGPFHTGSRVAVVGGGDAAVEGALFLSGDCREVVVVAPSHGLTAIAALRHQLADVGNVTVITDAHVERILGTDRVEGVAVTTPAGASTLGVDGVFVLVGQRRNADLVADLCRIDADGGVAVDVDMASDVPGLFAAGSARGRSPDQLFTAIGDGTTAGRSAASLLLDRPG